MSEPLIQCVNDILERTKKIEGDYIIWGAGTIGQYMLDVLMDKGIVPRCFVDDINSDRWGDNIHGIEIVSLLYSREVYPNATYILSSGYNHKIVPKAKGLKYIHYEDFCYIGNEDKIKKAFLLLEDKESQIEFLNRLDYKNTPKTAPKHDEEIYCYKMKMNEIIIDGGAYDGDTIKVLEKHNPSKIYAFEPDPQNFVRLFINTRNMIGVDINPYALYDHSGIISFSAKGDTHSLVGGSTQVEAVAIDDCVFSERISRIKLDIEGSEKQALRGAYNTIKRNRPILAICAYHRIDDLWNIPIMIHAIVPDYAIYLRSYDDHATDEEMWDGVCYGVPDERD